MKGSYSSNRPSSRGSSRPSSRGFSGDGRRSFGDNRTSGLSTGRDRTPSPDQMRYQVIGRTTDESDLIVQISPAFYEYVRSMAHQGVKPPRGGGDKEQFGKFNHPFHKDPMHTSYDRKPPKSKSGDRDSDKINLEAIDQEMDDEYNMIKRGFANIDKKGSKKPYIKSTKTYKQNSNTGEKPPRKYQDKR